jgi:hypothetical protein
MKSISVNRLSNYFESAKLAKLCLNASKEAALSGNINRSLSQLWAAVSYQQTAMNNVASIAFNKKPKR